MRKSKSVEGLRYDFECMLVIRSRPKKGADTPADPPASVVERRNIDFDFVQVETRSSLLFGVSFEIRAGEVVLLNGPSGGGM